MKVLKTLVYSLLAVAVSITFQLTIQAKGVTKQPSGIKTAKLAKQKRSNQAKQLKKDANKHTTLQHALDEVKDYLQHLDEKYKLKLSFDEKNNLLTTTSHMIYLKAGYEAPSTSLAFSDLYTIKRSLKGHLRMFNPEKFASPKTKTATKLTTTDLPRKLAKHTIRETTKDYLINTCGITDPQEVYTTWKLVKPVVNKKLDAASYRSDYDELLVSQATTGKVLQTVYQELRNRGIMPKKATKEQKLAQVLKKYQKKQEPTAVKSRAKKTTQKKASLSRVKKARRSQPSRRPYRSRKNVERSISLEQASNMVQEHVERQDLSKTDRIHLQEQIVKKITAFANPKGFVYPRRIQKTIDTEIAQFKKLQRAVKPRPAVAATELANEGEE